LIVLKTRQEIEKMRVAGRMVAEILALLAAKVKPGITTRELDQFAEMECLTRKAKPAFKGYGGFPFSICASPNEKVVHGFPSLEPLVEGDILSIDFGVVYDGFYGDSAVTLPVGRIAPATQALLDATAQSLDRAINACQVDGRLGDVSHAVQAYVEPKGFTVVREFVGHGIGTKLHESPQVPNFGPAGQGPKLKAGMVLAIEPMINAGLPGVAILSDGWTAVTADGRMSAHFEHTVAITDHGPEILTRL
jgi:methionyl aminopeptidase